MLQRLPEDGRRFCSEVPQILKLLETTDAAFPGSAAAEKGCMNSALFTEELPGYQISNYPKRLRLVEQSAVRETVVRSDSLEVRSIQHGVQTRFVMLCTNGYSSYTPMNHQEMWGSPSIRGIVDYMAGYHEGSPNPAAMRYYMTSTHPTMTRTSISRGSHTTQRTNVCCPSEGPMWSCPAVPPTTLSTPTIRRPRLSSIGSSDAPIGTMH